MQNDSVITFTECYTALNMDPKITNGDRLAAKDAVSEIVRSMPDPAEMPIPLDKEKTVIHIGSGFGALEGEHISKYYTFPKESLGECEADWVALSEYGYLPDRHPECYPKSYRTDAVTLRALERSTKYESGDHWYTYLHIGTARYALGDTDGALDAFNISVKKLDNPLARRNIATLYKNVYQNRDGAIENILRAYELMTVPERGLIQDLAKTLTALGEDEKWLTIYDTLPSEIKEISRLKLYSAIALVNLGRRDEAGRYLNESFEMPDIKEGELSVSTVWKDIYGDGKPLPDRLNFRMYEI